MLQDKQAAQVDPFDSPEKGAEIGRGRSDSARFFPDVRERDWLEKEGRVDFVGADGGPVHFSEADIERGWYTWR